MKGWPGHLGFHWPSRHHGLETVFGEGADAHCARLPTWPPWWGSVQKAGMGLDAAQGSWLSMAGVKGVHLWGPMRGNSRGQSREWDTEGREEERIF